MHKKCERLNCIVGPHMCAACQKHGAIKCDSPVREEKNEPVRFKPSGVRERRKALRVVEHQLQTAYLYTGTGFPLHSGGEQREDVSPPECSNMVEEPGEEGRVKLLKKDATDSSVIDSNILQYSPI